MGVESVGFVRFSGFGVDRCRDVGLSGVGLEIGSSVRVLLAMWRFLLVDKRIFLGSNAQR